MNNDRPYRNTFFFIADAMQFVASKSAEVEQAKKLMHIQMRAKAEQAISASAQFVLVEETLDELLAEGLARDGLKLELSMYEPPAKRNANTR